MASRGHVNLIPEAQAQFMSSHLFIIFRPAADADKKRRIKPELLCARTYKI
jgi:hypothetical protein